MGRAATDDKSNEITAIPEVLWLVDLRGAIATIDAMGTQRAIAKQIVDAEADFVLALKKNQRGTHKAVADYFQEQMSNDFRGIGARRIDTTETKHGRTEHRTYAQMPCSSNLPGLHLWAGLRSIGIAMLWSIRDGKETNDMRYFISSLPVKGQAVHPCGAQRLEHREQLPLVFGHDLSRGRSTCARHLPSREPCLAESADLVIAKAASEQSQCCHETPRVRLGRRLHARSVHGNEGLVAAGPELSGICTRSAGPKIPSFVDGSVYWWVIT